MKTLTKAEEDVMHILWNLKEANVASIINKLPEPKPAYNTISTIVRILENKNFVDYKRQGRGHIYFPIVKKSDYSSKTLNTLVDGYFDGSFKSLVSFFVKENDVSISDLESILNTIHKDKEL